MSFRMKNDCSFVISIALIVGGFYLVTFGLACPREFADHENTSMSAPVSNIAQKEMTMQTSYLPFDKYGMVPAKSVSSIS